MSYVEVCQKHGQHHTEICGECFDDLKEENARLREALEAVASHCGKTQLHECCVDRTCTPIFEDGQLVGHCAFGFGVNRGFNECAGIARDALEGK